MIRGHVAARLTRWLSHDTALLVWIALGKLALNMAFHGRYGYFRDELYYIACSDHLAWGYVDHPPLSIFILSLTRHVLGDSLFAIRFPAALAGVGVVVLAGLMARRLGGGRFAQALAALSAAMSPVVLGNAGRYFSMNAFDLLFWAWAAYLVLVILLEDRPRLWIAFGVVAGLGLLNKYSMLFFGFALVAGLLLTPHRRQFLRPWIWLGSLVAVLLVLPHLAWEQASGWPSLEFMRNASQLKNVHLSPLEFLSGQFMQGGFAQAAMWTLGLAYFFFERNGKLLRPFGWMYPVVFVVMVTSGAKAYYLTPIYTVYLAAGAVWLAALTQGPMGRWARPRR
jgi:4-amino-4-deoxy-L-arabinose transferase-like glycosyltransferase